MAARWPTPPCNLLSLPLAEVSWRWRSRAIRSRGFTRLCQRSRTLASCPVPWPSRYWPSLWRTHLRPKHRSWWARKRCLPRLRVCCSPTTGCHLLVGSAPRWCSPPPFWSRSGPPWRGLRSPFEYGLSPVILQVWGDVGQPLACLDRGWRDARCDNKHCAGGSEPTHDVGSKDHTGTGDRRVG